MMSPTVPSRLALSRRRLCGRLSRLSAVGSLFAASLHGLLLGRDALRRHCRRCWIYGWYLGLLFGVLACEEGVGCCVVRCDGRGWQGLFVLVGCGLLRWLFGVRLGALPGGPGAGGGPRGAGAL